MKVLIADDESVSRRLLEAALVRLGHEVLAVADGNAAWDLLKQPDAPSLAILDWNMPGCDGPEICRRVRQQEGAAYVYMMLVTSRNRTEEIVAGFQAGADDFVTKPFVPEELRARVRAGERIVTLEARLASQIRELQLATEHVHELQGLLPICMYCKRIRSEAQTWEKIESYIEQRSEAKFSHALCEKCLEERFPEGE